MGNLFLPWCQHLLALGTNLWSQERKRTKKKNFHVKILSLRAPWQRIFWVNQLPLEVIIVTCPGYKRSNRHVDLALIIINYEPFVFCDSYTIGSRDNRRPVWWEWAGASPRWKETNFEAHRVETNMNMPATEYTIHKILWLKIIEM